MRVGLVIAGAAVALATAFAQTAPDGPGVSVELNGAPLMHRTGIRYPLQAMSSGVEGTVIAQVKLAPNGEVVDAHIVSGPDELRATVLTSVLNWHFSSQLGGMTREISVRFEKPAAAPVRSGVPGGVLGGIVGSVPRSNGPNAWNTPSRIKSIQVNGLPEAAKNELLSQLPVHEGDMVMPEAMAKISSVARAFDEHLGVGINRGSDGETTISITAPGAMPVPQLAPAMVAPPGTINVTGGEQQKKLTNQTPPVYPPLAKQARISGVVHLSAIIGADGAVKSVQVISGHPLLVSAAMEAVKTWTYQPTLMNGMAVPVQTQIDVNFTLSEQQ